MLHIYKREDTEVTFFQLILFKKKKTLSGFQEHYEEVGIVRGIEDRCISFTFIKAYTSIMKS